MNNEEIKRVPAKHPHSDSVEETHPSFGMIQIGKFQGGGEAFFGSSVKGFGGISLTICRASRTRNLSTDWIHSGRELIRVDMTHTQFVDAITSGMNTGGVPCTIKYDQENGRIETPDDMESTLREKVVQDYKKAMKKYGEYFEEANEMIQAMRSKKGSVSKKEIDELQKIVGYAESKLTGHLPFILDSFNEDMEKISTHVKSEVLHSEVVRKAIQDGNDIQKVGGSDQIMVEGEIENA